MYRKRGERRRRGLKSGKTEVWALKERGKTGEKHEKGGKSWVKWAAGHLEDWCSGYLPDVTKMTGSGRGRVNGS